MDLPSLNFGAGQEQLVEAGAANPHTIVVLENGGGQIMPFPGSVPAVVWFPGQQ